MNIEETKAFEIAEAERDYEIYMKLELHPLMNPNSIHYDAQKKPTIQKMEHELSVVEMIGFCKGNIFKYQDRKEFKKQKRKDEVKTIDYANYLAALNDMIPLMSEDPIITSVFDAYELCKIKYRYEF